ncbi:hypothetical protein DXG01_006708 [Tephrocybe rancida]|nr:hypothetical protein DXG01_006708 [Tephrocybe rancida]
MKDTPNQPSTPYPGPPQIHYDEGGNAFIQDPTGRFVPLIGQFPIYPPGLPIPHMQNPPPIIPLVPTAAPSQTPGASSSRPPPVIDPALCGLPPLPDTSDDDLTDGPTIAQAQGHKPSSKVAGSRQKEKGKQRASAPLSKGKQKASGAGGIRKRKSGNHSSDGAEVGPEAKRGRPTGAGNYNNEDIDALLDAVEIERPIGQRGWLSVSRVFGKYSRKNNRPERAVKSLETKFKQLVKTTMPTGDGYCPPEVKRAHHIEELINERACTRDLDDDDFDGPANVKREHRSRNEEVSDDSSSDGIEIVDTPANKKAVRSAVVRRPDPLVSTARRKGRVSSTDLVSKLTDTFDPATIRARDAERAERSYGNTHLLALTQQLRDSQQSIEGLRAQISQLNDRVHEADRARDRAEMRLQMLQLAQSHRPPSGSNHPFKYLADRRDGHTRVATHYPEGGYSTYWVTDPSDSEKENAPPQASSSTRPRRHQHHASSKSHARSRRSVSRSRRSSRSRSRPRDNSPWFHEFQHRRHEEAFEEQLAIRPPSPSPFRSAAHDLGKVTEPQYFSAAAGDTANTEEPKTSTEAKECDGEEGKDK